MSALPQSSGKRVRTDDDDTHHSPHRRKAVRKRAVLACEECRSRKRRCDGAVPACSGCAKRMSHCVYSGAVESKIWHNSMLESLKNRLQELQAADVMPQRPNDNSAPAESPLSIWAPERISPPQDPTLAQGLVTNGSSNELDIDQSPRPPTDGLVPSFSDLLPPQDCVRAAAAPLPHQGRDAQDISFSEHLEPRGLEKMMGPLISEKSHVAKSGSGGHHGVAVKCTCDDLLLDGTQWSLPLRRVSDGLVTAYFSSFHRMYPFLHQPTFRRQYERLWAQDASSTESQTRDCSGLCRQKSKGKLFPHTLYTLFALATLTMKPGLPGDNVRRAESFFREAQKVDLLNVPDDEVGIEVIQLGLLMGFYLQSTEKFSKCWNVIYLTIRMAKNLGLDLETNDPRARGLFARFPTQLECEVRSRVWYGCIILEREVAMSFGCPSMITTGDTKGKMPEPVDDHYLSNESGKRNTQPKGLPSLMESYILTIKLYNILGWVLNRDESQCTMSARPETGEPSSRITLKIRAILDLDTSIMEWRDSTPDYIRFDQDPTKCNQTSTPCPGGLAVPYADLEFQAKRLYIRFLHIRLLILRPALELLYEKQQQDLAIYPRRPLEERLEYVLLRNIAAQCVICTQSLVEFLTSEIRSRNMLAWWYDVSYLHSCASTILMARLCKFGDGRITEKSLSTSWELCLEFLSGYTTISRIARKSYRLLRQSADRMLPDRGMRSVTAETNQSASDPTGKGQKPTGQHKSVEYTVLPTHQDHYDQGLIQRQKEPAQLERQLQSEGHPQGESSVQPHEPQMQHQKDYVSDEVNSWGDLGSNLWASDPADTSYWSFNPFFSQLETLPLNLDFSPHAVL